MIGIPALLELVSLERVTSKGTTFTMHTMFPKGFLDVDIDLMIWSSCRFTSCLNSYPNLFCLRGGVGVHYVLCNFKNMETWRLHISMIKTLWDHFI